MLRVINNTSDSDMRSMRSRTSAEQVLEWWVRTRGYRGSSRLSANTRAQHTRMQRVRKSPESSSHTVVSTHHKFVNLNML